MPHFTQKYTIVCFLEPENAPANFSAVDWPIHVTMLDTLKTNWSAEELAKAIRQVASLTMEFSIRPAKQAMFGLNKDVPVKLLEQDQPILNFHSELLSLAEEGSFVFNTPEFVGRGFLLHVTDQWDSRVNIGEIYTIMTVSLVDMFPGGDHMKRTIVETFVLSNSGKHPARTG